MKPKTRLAIAFALTAAGLFSLGAISDPATTALLDALRDRFYQVQRFRQLTTLYNDGTPAPYAAGFLDGMSYAINGDFNATARAAGLGDQWIETP